MRKLKFFLIGMVPGLLIMFFIFNKKGASCSGYLPDSRVRAEALTKKFIFSPDFSAKMTAAKMDEKFLRDSILPNGEISFEKSHAQKTPCPDYFLQYPEGKPRIEVTFVKCKDEVTFTGFKNLK